MVTFAELPGKDYFFETKQYFAVELRITTTQLTRQLTATSSRRVGKPQKVVNSKGIPTPKMAETFRSKDLLWFIINCLESQHLPHIIYIAQFLRKMEVIAQRGRKKASDAVDGRSLSHYLQGIIHPRWCRISSINSMVFFSDWWK